MSGLLDIDRIAHERAMSIAVEGASRGFMPVDLFGALAQIVANRNPDLVWDCLRALEAVVKSRPAILPADANVVEGPSRAQ